MVRIQLCIFYVSYYYPSQWQVWWWQVRYALSPDTRFDASGIGGKTNINYHADFDFYKRYLIEANAKIPKTIQALLNKWDREIFLNHNQSKGLANTDDAETIEINDDSEIAEEMRNLLLVESQQESDEPEITLASVDDQHEASENDSMYGDEEAMLTWTTDTPIQNMVSEAHSDSESVTEHPSPIRRPAPPAIPVAAKVTRATHAKPAINPANLTPEVSNVPAAEPLKRTRARGSGTRGRGRGSKTS